MNQNKRRMLEKVFMISQFSFWLLVWMFHSRTTKSRVNEIHERTLKLVHDDSPYLSFDKLAVKAKSFSIHHLSFKF